MTDQVNLTGDQDQKGDADSLGWRSALPDEFKEHDFVKNFTKPGDFVKSALDIKTEHDSLKTKMENAIFKPGEKSSPEEIVAFHKALGVPEKAKDYEFPKGEGVEHDEKMMDWAKDTFKAANLSKEQASTISQAWDGFIQGLNEEIKKRDAEEAVVMEKAKTEADEKLKATWSTDYDKNLELTKRAFLKFSGTEFDAFLEGFKDSNGASMGNHPVLIKAFYEIGKAMGDDTTPPGTPGRIPGADQGMIYDKSPAP